jgi:hypothetical protein
MLPLRPSPVSRRACQATIIAKTMPTERPETVMTERLTNDEIAQLARQAGLHLPPEYLLELADAYANVRDVVSRIPNRRPRGDEPAHVFVPGKFLPPER